ncbi:hypothetical protein ASF43_28800 [Pseudorhodoferax sp. Leaf267]|nr:hypothetical protein ASF43_28800 [Pseudorhodoferax sp. Leaf267]
MLGQMRQKEKAISHSKANRHALGQARNDRIGTSVPERMQVHWAVSNLKCNAGNEIRSEL